MALREYDEDPTPDPLLHLGRVDRVRVQVALVSGTDRQVREAFLVDVPVDAGVGFEEARVLAGLEPIVTPPEHPPLSYALEVRRSHDSWASEVGEVEVVLRLAAGSGADPARVIGALRGLLPERDMPPIPLGRERAVERGRAAVRAACPEIEDWLTVSLEQHDVSANTWTLGLRSAGNEEFVVEAGFLEGFADFAHLRRHPLNEVLDSVGVEG